MRSYLMAPLLLLSCSALAAAPVATLPASELSGSAAVSASTDKQHWSDLDGMLRNTVGHPNEYWRLQGADAASAGRWNDAFSHFRRAARFADKYSQHRISLMYWHGVGVEQNHALAYAWADLAAERLYPQFVLLREKMWSELTVGEREQAIKVGQDVYAEYGDAVAKKRFADAMAQAKRQTTGSHTGAITSNLIVQSPGTGGSLSGAGGPGVADLYADARWDIERYWKVEDVMWSDGSVNVGNLEIVDTTAPSQATHPHE